MAKETKKKLDEITLVVILYLIEKLNGVLGKTHLQKMLFLADLLSVKKFKEPITSLQFERYHYGPFSEEVNDYVNHLEEKGVVDIREFKFGGEKEKTCVKFYFNNKTTTKGLLFQKVKPEKIMLIDDVISSYGNVSLQEILDVVYRLETVKKSALHTPLAMAKIIEDESDEMEEIDIF